VFRGVRPGFEERPPIGELQIVLAVVAEPTVSGCSKVPPDLIACRDCAEAILGERVHLWPNKTHCPAFQAAQTA
ncbi:MAG: hypothetical protein AAGF25_15285, partial [Pseudomonadota bacterium]